ncbi:PTS sugar transporter subunit IIB [Streptomyces sp. YIM S03343]
MAKQIQILVACGSGVATSTVAVGLVEEILNTAGIPAKIYKCSLGELESRQNDVDLILTTANYKKELAVPHMSVFGLMSGVNSEAVEEKLLRVCREIQAN